MGPFEKVSSHITFKHSDYRDTFMNQKFKIRLVNNQSSTSMIKQP